MTKTELMTTLINLYEQRGSITTPCTQMIVDQYIRKLELKLKMLL